MPRRLLTGAASRSATPLPFIALAQAARHAAPARAVIVGGGYVGLEMAVP